MAKKLGVIGGLGPVATAYFYELVSRMTDAYHDQEHIDINIISKPSIPDRTDYILGRSDDSPLPHMIEAGNTLVALGADFIAIPCITAHYFHEELSDNIKAPIIHIICETVKYLKNHDAMRVGIMATEGTIESYLFQNELLKYNIEPIIPSKNNQSLVTSLIYKNVKAGIPVNMEQFKEVTEELKNKGADTIILGCTELSMIKRDENIGSGFIDALEVLAMCSVTSCGAKLKKEYINLIT
ncbi:MAG: amino acid racemase [Anaerolineaceae bacterium]|nr:MAG: amino acid racemase [Anaerolineaceae bacterium]